jgi:GntR family transcriptional regulator, transcriptional repressor for pyruvate dehydrogenase complex
MNSPDSAIAQAQPPQKRRSLSASLVDVVTQKIRDGVYARGEKMPTEAEIMAEHGVSRTVVREAFSRLTQAGLIVTRHGIGSFVSQTLPNESGFRISTAEVATLVDVIHVLELRLSIETECAALAAIRRNASDLAAMRTALEGFAAHMNANESTVDADFDLHIAIARATHNPHFVALMEHLGTTVIPRARVNSSQLAMEAKHAYLERVHREHSGVVTAIEAQDPDSARAAMRMHLVNSRDRLRLAAERSGA